MLGNVAFECPGMYEEGEGIEYTPLYTLDQIFADTILRVITSALALSRTGKGIVPTYRLFIQNHLCRFYLSILIPSYRLFSSVTPSLQL